MTDNNYTPPIEVLTAEQLKDLRERLDKPSLTDEDLANICSLYGLDKEGARLSCYEYHAHSFPCREFRSPIQW